MARDARKNARRPSAARRGRRRLPGRGRARRAARWLLVGAGFVAGVLAGDWAVRLDATVRARFDGQRFRVPSRVLSAPTLLYPGLDWVQSDLRGTLAGIGYQEAPAGAPLPPGHYSWGSERAVISLRAFEHPSRAEDAQLVELELEGNEIAAVRELPGGRERSAVQLEPETVGAYYGPDREQRELVRLGEVPRSLIDAIIAVEDQRFDSHHGIDPFRIFGALWANLRTGSITQGGSTLTQQLVKNFFLSPERTLSRKLQEAAMALIVELRYGKDEILECYLNEIYMGQRGATEVHGVGEASRLYFGKPVRELDLAESATLAAVIPGPNRLSPFDQTERARARRNLVLDLMLEQGRIDAASHDAAVAEPLRPAPLVVEPAEARFFLDALRRQLPGAYDFEALSSEGLRIYSTLDPRLQRIAARAVREGLAALEKRFPRLASKDPEKSLQACLVAVQPQTGQILALVGSRSYGESQFDRCTQAHRQAGSTFKPFVYVAALEPAGGDPAITLASEIDDEPLTIASPGAPVWRPANYDHEFHGRVSVREALERSMNVATARLAQQVGVDRVADVARRLGVESRLPLVPSLALGVADVTPIELARAYATLANGGVRPELRTYEDIVDATGHAIPGRSAQSERAIDAGTAYLATSLLEGVVDHGTAAGIRSAGLVGPIAGKTGTTDDEKDAWFVGFTPELVVTVWVGFDEPRKTGLTGASGALPIWIRFVKEATRGEVRGQFLPPPEIVQADIDPRSGALALDGCPERRSEVFIAGTEPARTCPEGESASREPATVPKPAEAPERPSRPPASRERSVLDWLRGLF